MKNLFAVLSLLVSVSAYASAPECGRVVKVEPKKWGQLQGMMTTNETADAGNVSGNFFLGVSRDFNKNMVDIQMAMVAYQSSTLLCRCPVSENTDLRNIQENTYFVARTPAAAGECK